MGCLSVRINKSTTSGAIVRRWGVSAARAGRVGSASARIERQGSSSARIGRIGGLSVRFGLVCGTNLDPREGILWASDGRLITLEGGYLIPAQ